MIYLQIHISVFLLSSLELVHRTVETESLTESHEGWLGHDSLRKGWSPSVSSEYLFFTFRAMRRKDHQGSRRTSLSVKTALTTWSATKGGSRIGISLL